MPETIICVILFVADAIIWTFSAAIERIAISLSSKILVSELSTASMSERAPDANFSSFSRSSLLTAVAAKASKLATVFSSEALYLPCLSINSSGDCTDATLPNSAAAICLNLAASILALEPSI